MTRYEDDAVIMRLANSLEKYLDTQTPGESSAGCGMWALIVRFVGYVFLSVPQDSNTATVEPQSRTLTQITTQSVRSSSLYKKTHKVISDFQESLGHRSRSPSLNSVSHSDFEY
jgi:hypothetical protein